MANIFGGLGGHQGRYDNELQAKIDKALAGKSSAQDKIQDFMKKDLGIDPDSVPMTKKQARIRINALMQERSACGITFTGNSLGIKYVQFDEDNDADHVCPTCNSNNYTYDRGDGTSNWHCSECDANFTPAAIANNGKKITQNDKENDWSDLMRSYAALQDDEDYSFSAAHIHNYNTYNVREQECANIVPIHEPVEPDPRFLSIGLTVRLCKKMIDGPDEFVYAKKGGLFNDSDVVLLPSLQPITDLSNWTVVEVL